VGPGHDAPATGSLELVKPIFEAISAKAYGEPCVAYMGPRGAGIMSKMVAQWHRVRRYAVDCRSLRHPASRPGAEQRSMHEVLVEWIAANWSRPDRD